MKIANSLPNTHAIYTQKSNIVFVENSYLNFQKRPEFSLYTIENG